MEEVDEKIRSEGRRQRKKKCERCEEDRKGKSKIRKVEKGRRD